MKPFKAKGSRGLNRLWTPVNGRQWLDEREKGAPGSECVAHFGPKGSPGGSLGGCNSNVLPQKGPFGALRGEKVIKWVNAPRLWREHDFEGAGEARVRFLEAWGGAFWRPEGSFLRPWGPSAAGSKRRSATRLNPRSPSRISGPNTPPKRIPEGRFWALEGTLVAPAGAVFRRKASTRVKMEK